MAALPLKPRNQQKTFSLVGEGREGNAAIEGFFTGGGRGFVSHLKFLLAHFGHEKL